MEGLNRFHGSEFYAVAASMKSNAENLLFLMGFAEGLPKVVRLLPGKLQSRLPAFHSVALLKPFELFISALKDLGSFVEMCDKLPLLLAGKVKGGGCRYLGRFADTIAITIDGLLVIPHKWNLIDFGRWSTTVGRFKYVKDGFALVSIGCHIHVTNEKIKKLRARLLVATKEEQALAGRKIEKATAVRWFDISIFALIVFGNMVEMGIALVLAPHLGLSIATVGALLLLGQWITSLSTGILGIRKVAVLMQ